MPVGLTYPSLQSVLEHLEAVKRAHIIARYPGLRRVDKLITLYLEILNIGGGDLTFNKLLITCDKDEVKFYMNGKTFIRQRTESQEEKMKKIINFYIPGRSTIRVHKMDWVHSSLPVFLPADLKLRVNFLKALYCESFEEAIPLIDPRSFPLKTVVTIPESSNFDSQIVQLAETLILDFFIDETVTVEDLKKLNNKTVVFECFNSKIDMVSLIKYHVETRKKVDTTFVISTSAKGFINDMLHQFELVFGEYKSDLDGIDERFIPELSKFSIPINNESRIQVYAIEDPEEKYLRNIIVKPVTEISGI
ncbi:hypothetical protein GCK72_022998 [Caenorhabditis remanei]|uniref:DUF38 domain-containing protein n=1 Tax=Caenorhabditis remanei TaxID=31234 RepID=A0A6A5FVG4_CAERE|nr:hypothetical protein GCK72_022998 [Caenorhabditis remanei]KAF1746542.1 hypothetical protein GCK72_022998 [Caenorhabditis remanei]